MKLILKDPKKNFGKVEFWEGDVAATLLATWYKSPPLCIETYEDIRTGMGEDGGGETEKASLRGQGGKIQAGEDGEVYPPPHIRNDNDPCDEGHKTFGDPCGQGKTTTR